MYRNKISKEQIPGGLAKGKSIKDFDPVALQKGTKVELEHTPDKIIAREIAMDHLIEDPNYYDKLEKIEKHGLTQPLSLRAFKVAMTYLRSSTEKKSLNLMKWLSKVTKQLGVGRDTYVVGGAVRNFLIQKPIKDIDIVIDTIKAGHDSDWLAKQLSKKIPVPTNVVTNQYGVAILTIKEDWEIEGENLKGEVIEIANARKESYGGLSGKGYKPSEVVPATIEEDLKRREFTFNTLLWRLMDLEKGPGKAEVIDLTGCGVQDLKSRTLQCPRDPDIVFSDDPTRILRSIKFTGKYGFKIPSDVASSIKRNSNKMKKMPWEAIANILVNDILNQPTARKSLKQMKDLGILDVISEMVREQKPFAAYMSNQLRTNRKIPLLLDMMELGFSARTPLSFLDKKSQTRLREITLGMEPAKSKEFVERLIKPPVDNNKIIDTLSLKGKDRGRIMPLSRELILKTPSLALNPRGLTEKVISGLR